MLVEEGAKYKIRLHLQWAAVGQEMVVLEDGKI